MLNLLFYYYVYVCALLVTAIPEMTHTVSDRMLSFTYLLTHSRCCCN